MKKENKAVYLGLDVGGTKIELAEFDENFRLIKNSFLPTNEFRVGSIDFIKSIEGVIAENLKQSIRRIGISFKGSINKGIIVHSSLLGKEGGNFLLEQKFSQKFGLPVKLENDVNAMAIAEGKFGQGQGVGSFVLLNLGTGIRISACCEGKIIRGHGGNAGEICQKQIRVSELGDKIYPVDDFISGKGIANVYAEISGKNLCAREIFEAVAYDKKAQEAVALFAKYLSEFLIEICYFYDPEMIIINGSLKKAAHIFLPEVIRRYEQNTSIFFQAKKIEISSLESGPCLGVVS